MKWWAFLLIGLSVLSLSGSPSTAEPVPLHATGIWSTTECGRDGLTLLLNARLALLLERAGSQFKVAIARAEWTAGTLILSVKGEELERQLSPDTLQPCDALPSSVSLQFADVAAVFGGLNDTLGQCRGRHDITAPCAAAIADLIDVTGDGTFSRPELRQAMRAASFFIAYRGLTAQKREAFVSLDKLYFAQLAAAVLGPFVVTHLIHSYDSDGDDAVSPKELLQERSPEQAVQGILADLVAKAPPAVVTVLMKSLPGFLSLP